MFLGKVLKNFEQFWGSRDQVDRYGATSLTGSGIRAQGKGLNFQAVIKSAAGAAVRKTKIQETRGAHGQQRGPRGKQTAGDG